MKDINSPPFKSVLQETRQSLSRFGRLGARILSNMSWPALLLSCVMLALLITIVPLVIGLFAVFLLLKWLIRNAPFGAGAKPRREQNGATRP
jgi:type II secretory pathway component PulF